MYIGKKIPRVLYEEKDKKCSLHNISSLEVTYITIGHFGQ